MVNEERQELLLDIIKEISQLHSEKMDEWKKQIDYEHKDDPDFMQRLTDPRNQQMETYMHGLAVARDVVFKRINNEARN